MSALETIEVEPGGPARYTVIWMHGLGADGHDFEPIVPLLGLPPEAGVRFIFPHAPRRPVTINGGFVMRAWYDILEIGLNAPQDEAGFRDSAGLIGELIERENQRGIGTERIALAGFSQGGALTLYCGLRYARRLAGMIVLSAYLPLAERSAAEYSENLKTPIFMGHGSLDPMLPMELGNRSRQRLEQLGASVSWHHYPIAHTVSPEEITHVGSFLRDCFGL